MLPVRVKGPPVAYRIKPAICQFETNRSINPEAELRYRRFSPNGKAYVPLLTNTCVRSKLVTARSLLRLRGSRADGVDPSVLLHVHVVSLLKPLEKRFVSFVSSEW